MRILLREPAISTRGGGGCEQAMPIIWETGTEEKN